MPESSKIILSFIVYPTVTPFISYSIPVLTTLYIINMRMDRNCVGCLSWGNVKFKQLVNTKVNLLFKVLLSDPRRVWIMTQLLLESFGSIAHMTHLLILTRDVEFLGVLSLINKEMETLIQMIQEHLIFRGHSMAIRMKKYTSTIQAVSTPSEAKQIRCSILQRMKAIPRSHARVKPVNVTRKHK